MGIGYYANNYKTIIMDNAIIKAETFDLAKPEQSLKVAEVLQRFVKEKRLTANIKGKDYPLVEAWLFAGSQLGLYPILIDIQNLSDEGELKYMAQVEIRRIDNDRIMGRGIAVCSNKEASKRLFDEYAILSMAQTRAEGKAFRMLLSWIMKAAGFEATPAEEMDFAKTQEIEDVPTKDERQLLRNLVYESDLNDDEKEAAFSLIETCSNYTLYEKIQHQLEARRRSIDTIQNPKQEQINKHLKKSLA